MTDLIYEASVHVYYACLLVALDMNVQRPEATNSYRPVLWEPNSHASQLVLDSIFNLLQESNFPSQLRSKPNTEPGTLWQTVRHCDALDGLAQFGHSFGSFVMPKFSSALSHVSRYGMGTTTQS